MDASILTSALDGGEWSATFHLPLYPKERAPGTYWIRDWVCPLASMLRRREKSCTYRDSNTDHPVRSPSLWRLSYPDS
jgi:hypothetical protein